MFTILGGIFITLSLLTLPLMLLGLVMGLSLFLMYIDMQLSEPNASQLVMDRIIDIVPSSIIGFLLSMFGIWFGIIFLVIGA